MISTNQFKNGMSIVVDEDNYTILEFQHVKPGKGGAFVRTKLKNMRTGAVVDRTFRAGEKFENVHTERKPMTYLYNDPNGYVFMDDETYEQISLSKEMVQDIEKYLVENQTVYVLHLEGKPFSVELPLFVELGVAQTDPGLKGDTATGGTKPATLESGAVIQVPLFVNVGDVIKVDTRTDEYITRVS